VDRKVSKDEMEETTYAPGGSASQSHHRHLNPEHGWSDKLAPCKRFCEGGRYNHHDIEQADTMQGGMCVGSENGLAVSNDLGYRAHLPPQTF